MLRPKRKNEVVLAPVHPNEGLRIAYQRKLDALVEELHASVLYWVKAAYRANEPELLAQDESPAAALRKTMRKLARRWLQKFDVAAQELAEYFATAVSKRSDAALKGILKRGGFSIEWRMTRAQNDVIQATVAQNVGLIKSIPAQYLAQIEQSVMRSVQTGRDVGALTKEIEAHGLVTKRRAAFIATSQNNLATSALTRARQLEMGLTTARWQHSHGGREPRKSHVANSGKEYDVSTGWLDPEVGEHIWPGQLPNCRCVARSVIKGFS